MISSTTNPAETQTENWVSETLCSFGEKVRIELGPQVVEIEATDENLSDDVTPERYFKGARDADGRLIRVDDAIEDAEAVVAELKSQADGGDERAAKYVSRAETTVKTLKAQKNLANIHGIHAIQDGDVMKVVDNKSRFASYVWKIYVANHEPIINNNGEVQDVVRFVKVDEKANKDAALQAARKLLEGAA